MKSISSVLTAAVLFGFGTSSAGESVDNPFGIASGAQWAGDYPKFEPILRDAGVG